MTMIALQSCVDVCNSLMTMITMMMIHTMMAMMMRMVMIALR